MGPEFYQTGMGRKFFDSDLPELIKAIDRLAEAIEKSNALYENEGVTTARTKRPDR